MSDASRLQHLLNVVQSTPVHVDGIMGPRTMDVYQGLPQYLRELVDLIVSSTSPDKESSDVDREWVLRQAENIGLPRKFVDNVVKLESNWKHHGVISPTGAEGLFQLTKWPIKQHQLDVGTLSTYDVSTVKSDFKLNVEVGLWYLTYCAKAMNVWPLGSDRSDWAKTYAAYNLGPSSARKLASKVYDSSTRDLWALQASSLKKGGIENYLWNVENVLFT